MATKIRNCLRLLALWLRRFYLVWVYGMDIASSARISWGAKLDKTFPKGIHIGDESYCASGCLVLTHDFSRGVHTDTRIGKRCFVGADAIILPGVVIGDSVVVGAGSVVTKDVPSGCVVAGNPARTVREGVRTERFGRIRTPGTRWPAVPHGADEVRGPYGPILACIQGKDSEAPLPASAKSSGCSDKSPGLG